MKSKIIGIFVCMLLIAAVVLPVAGTMDEKKTEKSLQYTDLTTKIIPTSKMNLLMRRVTLRPLHSEDFDPLDEHIIVTVTINEIRALKTIDILSNPDFYLKVTINDKQFVSDVWENMRYLENLNWSASCEVPKDTELVNVTIALWDKNNGMDLLCDISPDYGTFQQRRTAELTYSIATGIWWGDDNGYNDLSGTGRLSGIDDHSIYEEDRDCELWFTITQTDFDGDGFPYWLEVNMYNTSPLINNRGEDADGDGIPIEWEYRFGLWYFEGYGYYMDFNPFVWEDHATIDYDKDGLNNIEEYKTWQWGSCPWQQDIFIELDQMEIGLKGKGSFVPIEAFDILRDSYARHNIVWHIDDGRLGGGEETIPFREHVTGNDLSLLYWKYFMHEDAQNWRRGVFRWCIVGYNLSSEPGRLAPGFIFESKINETFAVDCIYISTLYHDMRANIFPIIDGLHRRTFNREMNRASVYAGAIMHETGHTLGLMGDIPGCIWPWEINYWVYAPYKSCMNYRYVYRGIVDYSDGSQGKNDFDDWDVIDLALFNPSSS